MTCLASRILSLEEPHPWVLLANTAPLVDAKRWQPLFLGGLLFLDGFLPVVQLAQGSGLLKVAACGNQKPSPLRWRAKSEPPRVDFHSLAILTFRGQPFAPSLSPNFVAKTVLVQPVLCDLCSLFQPIYLILMQTILIALTALGRRQLLQQFVVQYLVLYCNVDVFLFVMNIRCE